MPDTRSPDTPTTFATKGVRVERRYTEPGVHPFDAIDWELRDAEVGKFKQEQVEFPKTWSQNATNIVAQKYFRGQVGSPERESSVKQMVGRVAGTITGWGRETGYFSAAEHGGDEAGIPGEQIPASENPNRRGQQASNATSSFRRGNGRRRSISSTI